MVRYFERSFWVLIMALLSLYGANKHFVLRAAGIVLLGTALCSCASVKSRIADLDFVKLPEFREDAANIGNYPDFTNAPQVPKDVRSAKQWDKDAKKLLAKRDGFIVPPAGPEMSQAEIEREMQNAANKVQAYKLDDPQ